MPIQPPQTCDSASLRPWLVSSRAEYSAEYERDFDHLGYTTAQIKDLPFEIVSQIFMECVNSHPSFPADNTTPFVLLFVCKQWRSIALNNPSLFASVSISPYRHGMTAANIKDRCKFLSQWLSFSRSKPLNVRHNQPGTRFRVGPPLLPAPTNYHATESIQCRLGALIQNDRDLRRNATYHAEKLFATCLSEERRWKTLDISLDDASIHQLIFFCRSYTPSAEAPCFGAGLQSLRIELYSFSGVERAEHVFELLQWVAKLPELEIFELHDRTIYVDDLNLVPFEQMKKVTFHCRYMTPDQSLRVMSKCLAANELNLIGGNIFSELGSHFAISQSPQTLYNLVRVQLLGIRCPIELLSFFTLPCLEDLQIVCSISPYLETLKSIFEAFLIRSNCSLKRILIRDPNMTAREVISFFTIPALRRVAEVDFSFMQVLWGLSTCIFLEDGSENLPNGLRFMCWRDKKEVNAEERSSRGYHIGWKDLKDDETLKYQFGDGLVKLSTIRSMIN